MVTCRSRPGLLALLPVLLLSLQACAAHGPAERPHAPAASGSAQGGGPIYTTRVPGVPDSIHDTAVVFTRRLPTTGEAIAFVFVPREVTTGGNLVGDLYYTGRRTTGSVERVLAALSFSADEGRACGRVLLQIEPVVLERLAVRAAFPAVSVDVRRAGGAFGRAAAALCEGADRLVALLRDLDAALRSLGEQPGTR